MDMEASIIRHEEQLKTLFNTVEEIKNDVNKISSIATSIQQLSGEINLLSERLVSNNTLIQRQLQEHQGRITALEDDKRYKVRQLWTYVASGVIGAIVGYLMKMVLR